MSNSESKHVNLKFVELPSSCILGRFWNHKIFTDLNSTRPVFKNAPHMVWHTTLYLDDTVSTYNNQITKNFKQIDSQSESEILITLLLRQLDWTNCSERTRKETLEKVALDLFLSLFGIYMYTVYITFFCIHNQKFYHFKYLISCPAEYLLQLAIDYILYIGFYCTVLSHDVNYFELVIIALERTPAGIKPVQTRQREWSEQGKRRIWVF